MIPLKYIVLCVLFSRNKNGLANGITARTHLNGRHAGPTPVLNVIDDAVCTMAMSLVFLSALYAPLTLNWLITYCA